MSTGRLLPPAPHAVTEADARRLEGGVVKMAEHVTDLGRAETTADEDRSAITKGQLQKLRRLRVVGLTGNVDDDRGVRAERERGRENLRFHAAPYSSDGSPSAHGRGTPRSLMKSRRPRSDRMALNTSQANIGSVLHLCTVNAQRRPRSGEVRQSLQMESSTSTLRNRLQPTHRPTCVTSPTASASAGVDHEFGARGPPVVVHPGRARHCERGR